MPKNRKPPKDPTFETPVTLEEWALAKRIFEAYPNAVKIKCYKDTQQRNTEPETFPIPLPDLTLARTRIIVNTYEYEAKGKLTSSEIQGLPEEIGDPNIYSALHHSFIKWPNNNKIFALDTQYLFNKPKKKTTIKLAQDEDGDLYVLKIMNYATASDARRIQRAYNEAYLSFEAKTQEEGPLPASRFYHMAQNKQKVMVMYPYLGYDMIKIQKIYTLNLPSWIFIALQMIKILCDLHEKRIVHCDIKPSNFVFDPKTLKVSLIDFGYALPYLADENYARHERVVGTEGYIAPEISDLPDSAAGEYNWNTDIYSLGCCIKDLFPKNDNDVDNTDLNTQQKLIDFMDRMCSAHPNTRPSRDDMQIFFNTLPEDVKADLEDIQNEPSYNALRRQERAEAPQEMTTTESASTTPETRDDDTLDNPNEQTRIPSGSPVEEETKHGSLSTHPNSFLQNQNKDDSLSPAEIDKAPNDPCPSLK